MSVQIPGDNTPLPKDQQKLVDSFFQTLGVTDEEDLNVISTDDPNNLPPPVPGQVNFVVFSESTPLSFTMKLPDGFTGLTLPSLGGSTSSAEGGITKIFGNKLDNLFFGNDGKQVFKGAEGDDLLFGQGGADTLIGGSGKDTVFGGKDNDLLSGGKGNDELHGEKGNDTIKADAGNDTLAGDQGKDLLYGLGGNDELFGGNDNDTLFGGTGNDTLYGGSGSNQLTGGSGKDTFVIDGDAKTDHITDFNPKFDKIDLSDTGAKSFKDLTITETKDGLLVEVKGGGKFVIEGNFDWSAPVKKWFIF